jgi:hypothetical protein
VVLDDHQRVDDVAGAGGARQALQLGQADVLVTEQA